MSKLVARKYKVELTVDDVRVINNALRSQLDALTSLQRNPMAGGLLRDALTEFIDELTWEAEHFSTQWANAYQQQEKEG